MFNFIRQNMESKSAMLHSGFYSTFVVTLAVVLMTNADE